MHSLVLSHRLMGTPRQFSGSLSLNSFLLVSTMVHRFQLPQCPWTPIFILSNPGDGCALSGLPFPELQNGKFLLRESCGDRRTYLVCFYSFKDHHSVLHVVQRLKTLVSYILSNFEVVYSERENLVIVTPSRSEAETFLILVSPNFTTFRHNRILLDFIT